MFFKRSIKRFAHVNGFTFVTYSENGEIITSGTDGDIRIWKEISDDDPSSQCIGENGNCCVQYTTDQNAMRLLASSDNVVQAFKYPEFERECIELRFNGLVTSIKVNKIWLVAGSEDHSIKAQKLNKSSDEVIELKGHDGPIFHIALNNKNHVATSSGDGTVKIWNLETQENVKTFDGFEKFDKFNKSKTYFSPAFEKSGRYLAFPKGSLINVLETVNWEVKFKLENNEIKNDYTVCNFSHCGSYLAAGTMNGEISIWSLVDNSKIKGEIHGEEIHPITSIEWNPKDLKEVAFCDADGQLSTIKLKSSKSIDEDGDKLTEDEDVRDPNDIYDAIDFRDEDEENENCVALEKLKNETLKLNGDSSSESEDEDSKTVKSQQMSVVGSEFRIAKFILQPPFQPGSTPDHLEHRFMVWNHVGQVLCHSTPEENSIIVEFHDTTLHPSIHILNTLNHQMASLSTTSLALATKETPCKLVVIALLSSGNKEWSATMPDCEEIQVIATGKTFIAVATDAGYLRIFTTMGSQREVLMVPGPVVCMSAYDNKLVVAYHSSNTCNKYSIMIINILGLAISNRNVEIPFAKDTKLNWLGFSDCGSIIAYESSGRLLSYNIKKNLWMPFCDLSNHVIGASDSFFIVGVSESSQKIRTSLCRGTNYPLTNPRPIMREIDYSLPLCSIETEKSKIEECLVRSVNFEMESSSKALVENGLKLFSTALSSELESRAFEIVELISDKKLIELAAKYASQKGRMHMSNKISKLLNDFEEKEIEKKSMMDLYEKETKSFTEAYEMDEPKNSEAKKIETSTPLIAPRPMISQKKTNPFKKSNNNSSSTAVKALDHLKKKSIGYNDSTTNSDDENKPSNVSKSNRSIVSADTPRPGNFSQWFIANKEDLKANNPSCNDAELIKIARNIYKELTQKTKGASEENDQQGTPLSAPLNKRKLDLNDDSGSTAKLAKYGFIEN